MKHRLFAAALTASVSSAALADDFVVVHIRDFDMPNGNWQAFVGPGAFGGFFSSANQAAAGGNFGPYRAVHQASTTGPAGGMTVHAARQTWTPLVRGPINTLHMTLDVNCFDGGTSNAVAFGLVVIQSGVIYIGPTFTALTNSGWRTDLRGLDMTAASFSSSASEHPDFSAGGGLVTFGFYTSNGTGNGTPINSTSGADNFFVTIGTTPQAVVPCGPADVGGQGGVFGPDGALDNNDFVVFINLFFSASGAADYGAQGGLAVPDGHLDNNDFVVFIDRFFSGC